MSPTSETSNPLYRDARIVSSRRASVPVKGDDVNTRIAVLQRTHRRSISVRASVHIVTFSLRGGLVLLGGHNVEHETVRLIHPDTTYTSQVVYRLVYIIVYDAFATGDYLLLHR